MQWQRAIEAGVQEIKKFVPKLWRAARELFHEITGFVFLALAVFFTVGQQGLIRMLQNLDDDPDSFPRLLLVAAFVFLFGAFGVSSFLRARRISRER